MYIAHNEQQDVSFLTCLPHITIYPASIDIMAISCTETVDALSYDILTGFSKAFQSAVFVTCYCESMYFSVTVCAYWQRHST